MIWQEIKLDIVAKRGVFKKRYLLGVIIDPTLFLIVNYRFRNRLIKYGTPGKVVEKFLWLWAVWFTGCYIQAKAEIEGGVDFVHAQGIFIGTGVTIKSGARILQQVTIGVKDYPLPFRLAMRMFCYGVGGR